MIKPWPKLSETVQKVGWKKVVTKTFDMPDGAPAEYTTIGNPGGRNAAIVAITTDNKVVVARQFRPGPEAIFDELPGGGVNAGEDSMDAAVRELLEETGYSSQESPIALGTACRDAYVNETNYYYLLRNCTQVAPPAPDDREFVEPALITIPQLIENAKTAKMSDAVGVLLAYDYLQKIMSE